MLGSGNNNHAPHTNKWVFDWLHVLIGYDSHRYRYSDLRELIAGTWYQGNLVMALAKEDKEYILAHL
jgi:hypothetical protein